MRIALRIWLALPSSGQFLRSGSLRSISVLILRTPGFPLGITFVETRGLPGLWITVPSFLLGIAGIILLMVRRTSSAKWLLVYSVFWTVATLFGVLEKMRTLVHTPLAVCITGMCTTLPVTLAIFAAFGLCAFWYWREGYPPLAQ
jgi:hypothetical protein